MKKVVFYPLCIFSLLTMITACKKSSNDSNSSSADYYYVGKVDNASVKYEVTASSGFITDSYADGSLNTPPDTSEFAFGGNIYDDNSADGVPDIGIIFQTMKWVDVSKSDSVFLASFSTGTKPFVTTMDLGPNGVSITYENLNNYYSSVGGPGITQPSSSYFKVVDVKKVEATTLTYATAIVKAEIKATLYEYDWSSGNLTGNTMTVEGTISVPIEKIL